MEITKENEQLWRDLYKAAETFKKLKPWSWMYDSDMFGVKDPETGEIGYCCIMGNAEQVYALAVYTGAEGLSSYWDVADGENDDPITAGLSQKCIMVSFEDRAILSDKDRAQIKALGLKYRGKKQWVQFRDYSPGLFPWYITDEQARILLNAIRQSMDVALRYDDDETLLEKQADSYLVRVPKKTENGLTWSDEYIVEPDLDKDEEDIEINPFIVNRLKKDLKRHNGAILFALSYMRQRIQEHKDVRPFFPRLALWISYPSYMIVSQEMFGANMETEFGTYFFNSLEQLGFIPGQIVVPNETTYNILEPYAIEMEIELIYAPQEQGFKDVFDSLSRFL